jgi:signal transduction histidine kinase
VSALERLAGAWLRRRSPTRRVAAWALAVAGPALLTLAALPLRSSLVLGGFLFSALLLVIASAVIGGLRPALTGVVLSVLARVFLFAPPFHEGGADLQPNLVSLVAFAVAGTAVAILIGELAQLAEEQASSRRVEASMRRVATLVARAAPADELFAAVTEEAGRQLAADFVRMARYEPGDWLTILAAWGRTGEHFPIGSRWPHNGENISSLVLQTGRPARLDNFAAVSGPLAVEARERGVRHVAGAPVIVQGRPWGVMIAGSINERPLPADTEARLGSFTELVATAIANADSRAGLARLAEEQAALRRVATLAARGVPPEEVFAVVAREAGQLLPVDSASMCRFESDHTLTFVAQWGSVASHFPVGSRWMLGGHNLGTLVFETGRPARIDSYADSSSGALGAVIRESALRSAVATPIIVQGRLWGLVAVGSSGEKPLPSDTEARLASFTELVDTAIANAENLTELTASRARVVTAADKTRRRIERDLHDGAQQRLVSLGLTLRVAQAAVPPQLGELEGELASVAKELAGVLEDLQEMARGIHPAILARGGLGPALKTLARRCALPVELDVRGPARLPERVEVAAYYVVAEALTNAAKHAHASFVHVDVEPADRVLHLRVRDDGCGGADPVLGTGLVGLKDRVEALGGTITVHSPVGAGTSVHAEFPLAD